MTNGEYMRIVAEIEKGAEITAKQYYEMKELLKLYENEQRRCLNDNDIEQCIFWRNDALQLKKILKKAKIKQNKNEKGDL